ncbi:MAG: hypothetical protein MUC63_06605 [Planctomycetes bacterium]|nr:hypothetical protein [Planctomycetota bacterium]
MERRKFTGSTLVLTVVILTIVAGIAAVLFFSASQGRRGKSSVEWKFRSREIALSALDLSVAAMRQATDGIDNDGDGEIDESIRYGVDLLDPAVAATVEGALGRVGTAGWTPSDDLDRNGRPDFGEGGIAPVPCAGGVLIAYTVFSQRDGCDNDGDGCVDEDGEAGWVTIWASGAYGDARTDFCCKGRFTDLFAPPGSPPWSPDAALLCGGNLALAGAASVAGLRADVHSNGSLSLRGRCTVAGDATAAAGLTRSGAAAVGGTVDGAAPHVALPDVDPAALRGEADFVLREDGRVEDRVGAVVHDATRSGPFRGWSPEAGGWRFGGDGQDPALARGTYYVCGDASIAGTGPSVSVGKYGGGGTATFFLSVIATGSVQASGNTRLQACHPDGLLFVAGGDVRITGTPSLDQLFQGVVAAREQVFIGGTPEIQGAVVAQDAAGLRPLVAADEVPGTPLITYDGGLSTRLPLLDPAHPWFRLDPKLVSYEER